jgi:hypothetical protein
MSPESISVPQSHLTFCTAFGFWMSFFLREILGWTEIDTVAVGMYIMVRSSVYKCPF